MIYELNVYKPHNGKAPFEKWLTSLKDTKTKQIIQARIDRAVFGNLGDIKGLIMVQALGFISLFRGKRFYCS